MNNKDLANLKSDEARYIVENYRPVGKNEFGSPEYQDDDAEIMTAIMQSLPQTDQAILSSAYFELRRRYPSLAYAGTKARQERRHSINTLIRHYKDVKGKKVAARCELQSRFDYQSFSDQMRIMRLFLKGTKADREWCYRKMLKWWDEALRDDLMQVWIEHHDAKCVRTAVQRLPEAFIIKHQKAMGELDYKSVCARLASDEGFVIDRSRLNTMDYCFVIAHSLRHISDEEADHLLFGFIKQVLESDYRPWVFRTHHGRGIRDRLDDKLRYRPSLLFNKSISYVIWALGQSGNTATLIKFHRWQKTLQDNMPQYLAEEMDQEGMLALISKDFHKYLEWNWDVFAAHALLTVSGFIPDNVEELQQSSDDVTPDMSILMLTPKGEFIEEDLDNCPF